MPRGQAARQQTFWYKATLIFALTSILPLLLFLYVMERHELVEQAEVALVLGASVVIAVLGFVFFQRIARQISAVAEDFLRLEQGESQGLGEREAPRELSEMARIAEAFHKILADLKANTQELENLIYKLSTLSEVTELVSRLPNIAEVLQIVLHRTMSAVNARIGSIMLLDDTTQTLRIAAASGLEESVVARTTIRLGEDIAGRVAQSGESVLVDNLERDPRFSKANDPKYETASFICIPLRVREKVIGVLNLSKKGDRTAFSESDLKFLTTVLNHISFAVENARLLKEAREAAVNLRQVVQDKSRQLDQAQQQVLLSARLSAMGQLIAGVAHELNNPLTTMMGYSELLMAKVRDAEMCRDLGKIFEEAQRASKIVQSLLSFARREPAAKRLGNINDILQKVLEVLAYDLRLNNVEVSTELAADLPPTMVDAHQLQQVFLNIVNNAHQAMLEGEKRRKLTVRTREEGDRIGIEFTDTGPGIPPEHLDRIFDPFFTTKEQGKGTGLGLSVSYGIVKAHGGEIAVSSRVGEGATFMIELPVVTEASAPATDDIQTAQPTRLDIRKFLVIEDEGNVNELITSILTHESYQVDAVRSGDLGLRKLLEEEYDLIGCDLRMPGMDGQQLYQEAKLAKPRLAERFIFLTGDIISEETRSFLEETGNIYIMKPFTMAAFLDLVERAWQRMS